MNLNRKETAWLSRFYKTMAAAPGSLAGKVGSYTVGDQFIVLFDQVKFDDYIQGKHDTHSSGMYDERDKCIEVDASESEIGSVSFPFSVESTAG